MEERKKTKFGRKKISTLTHKTRNNARKGNETKQKIISKINPNIN